jgi:CHAT domain-containing protein
MRLCFVLAFSMVVSRPSATIHTGSPDSSWWGSKESVDLRNLARKQISDGDYAAAEEIFAQGVVQAKHQKDRIATARYLSGVAGARRARFDYQGALSAYLESKHLAESMEDWYDLGAVDLNLSALYENVLDLDSALRAIEGVRAAADKAPALGHLPEVLLQIARLHDDLDDQDPAPLYLEAIQAAQDQRDTNERIESQGWSLLGYARMSHGDLHGAEEAFLHGFYNRRLFIHSETWRSYLDLGALRFAQAEAEPAGRRRNVLLNDAARFTNLARQGDRQGVSSLQRLPQQGRIRLARGDARGALQDLGAAVDAAGQYAAGQYRGIIPMALASVSGAAVDMENRVFSDFVEVAANYGTANGESKWIERSFLAEELTRGANRKDGQVLVEALRRKLPLRFWGALAELRAEEARLRSSGISGSPASNRLRLELTNLEAQAGIGLRLGDPENFRSHGSMIHLQAGLSDSTVLLSFHLGTQHSFLWAVTRSGISAYRLAPGEQIRRMVQDFREALQAERPEAEKLAKQVYRMLFGQLKWQETDKRDWLVSPADALLQLPFAALMTGDARGNTKYLAELHTLQIASGTLGGSGFDATVFGEGGARFLGVGDPIYNVADPRWRGSNGWFGIARANHSELNRLPGSGVEVELSAQSWPNSTVLKGTHARIEEFRKALDDAPAVIHLATHVIRSSQGTNEAFLAFGLDPDGQPGLLGTSDVAMLSVPRSLVVMTGCESAGGGLQAGIGLENLTRAWTLAGASAVVATQWPVRDSDGEFLARFYRYLHHESAPEALRKSQIDLIHSGGRSSSPAVWAAYQIYLGQVNGPVQ